ncbi:MAG: hypothetical protein PVF15_06850 [Candidatus Bathyarchaeota archaeon]
MDPVSPTDKGKLTAFKNELIRRLEHIQRLAKQKNYSEIEELLEKNYI